MRTARLQRGSALLLATTLLLAALPAAAQPAAGTGETALAPAWLQAATAWLAGLLPGSVPGASLDALSGPGAEPDHETSLETQQGPESDPCDEPTVEPQRGPDADPLG